MVIEAVSKGRRHLYLRALDSEEPRELEGSIDATSHFWSPDGRFLAFFADGKLKKIPAAGGNPEELCDAPFALAGTWNQTGTILFSKLDPPGIYSAPDSGGEAVRITTPAGERTETNHIWPHFLPDGRRFLYLANRAPGASGVTRELRVASLDSKENRALTTRIASRVEYVPPGFLVYAREGALFAQRFDDRSARLSGEPQQLAANVHYFYGPSLAAFSTSETGDLVYQRAAGLSRLVWFDRQGKEIGQLGAPSLVKGLRISPDGGSAAAAIGDPRWGTSDIWVFDAGRGISTRLHSDPVDEMMPVWAADGSKLLYRSDRQGPPDIYEIAVGVPGSEKPVLALPGLQQPEDVSRDGRLLAYVQEVASTVWNIWLLPLEGERKPAPWRSTRFNESSPRFSPDGRWIAYESNESGDPEIYVALTNGGGEKRRISPGGGRRPRWRRDGKELYYSDRGGVMAVPVTPGSRWESGTPAPLFRVEPDIENYDVAPDGSRFLVILPLEKVRESPLRVILNWTAAMNRP